MLKRVCTSLRDWSVTRLDSKKLKKAIIIFRRIGKWRNESWEVLLGDADPRLPV